MVLWSCSKFSEIYIPILFTWKRPLLLLQSAQSVCETPAYPARNAHRSSLPESKADVHEAACSPHSVSRLRMSGVLPPVPQVFLACIGTTLLYTFPGA
jgi:hypothetical protein